jgi:D-xylose transport system permease protein
MSTAAGAEPTPGAAVAHERTSVADAARGWWQGVRAGDLGSLPIIVGLIIIAIVFQ